MARPNLNHIRSNRKLWRLSQRELAVLSGFKSPLAVSRTERSLGKPTLNLALACEVMFKTPVSKLFPGLFAEITENVLNECEILHERIKSKDGSDIREKRKLLRKLLDRAEP